ncbi:MAG: response regulator receiver modulated serine phosphatase [Labilithrix sp.]|nr:response regulator receiver modulated serine phosphatase [Labilithrix sp.]
MSRIVLLIEARENRRLLVEWLAQHHEVIVARSPAALEAPFDLGIVDGPSLQRYGPWIESVKRAVQPVFLPFLFVAHRQGVGVATANAWERIDELIVSPVEKVELRARVETLLRARHLSVANAALRQRLEAELARAHEVQAGLLPRAAPHLRGFELAARCIPAREVSGDFYDWDCVGDAAVLSVGDVMGKGAPAALLAATARAVLRAVARQNAPGAALDLVRETMNEDLERTSSFVTLFHARVTVEPHEVRYVDAGHGHALVRRATGAIERLRCGGRPVGFPASAPYQESAVRMEAEDLLLVYSDGLLEGTERTPEEMIDDVGATAPASAIVEELIDRAPRHATADDVTVLVLKCCCRRDQGRP